jgi:curli biogenesis system outer membrane secretion channel CsgG
MTMRRRLMLALALLAFCFVIAGATVAAASLHLATARSSRATATSAGRPTLTVSGSDDPTSRGLDAMSIPGGRPLTAVGAVLVVGVLVGATAGLRARRRRSERTLL